MLQPTARMGRCRSSMCCRAQRLNTALERMGQEQLGYVVLCGTFAAMMTVGLAYFAFTGRLSARWLLKALLVASAVSLIWSWFVGEWTSCSLEEAITLHLSANCNREIPSPMRPYFGAMAGCAFASFMLLFVFNRIGKALGMHVSPR